MKAGLNEHQLQGVRNHCCKQRFSIGNYVSASKFIGRTPRTQSFYIPAQFDSGISQRH